MFTTAISISEERRAQTVWEKIIFVAPRPVHFLGAIFVPEGFLFPVPESVTLTLLVSHKGQEVEVANLRFKESLEPCQPVEFHIIMQYYLAHFDVLRLRKSLTKRPFTLPDSIIQLELES